MRKALTLLVFATVAAFAQPAASLMPNLYWQPTVNGVYNPGAKLCSYAAGTTTPLATYTDSTAATPNTNPIILDSNGGASVWVKQLGYKFILLSGGDGTCSTGSVLGTWDNVWAIFSQVTSLNTLKGALTLVGTTNEITVSPSGSTITLATPQPIGPGASVQFQQALVSKVLLSGASTVNNGFYLYSGGGPITYIDGVGNLTIPAAAGLTATGAIYLNGGMVIHGGGSIDTSSNAILHNLTVTGSCTGCAPISTQNIITGSRAFTTVYHNTGSTAMNVSIYVDTSSGGKVEAVTDATATPAAVVAGAQCGSSISVSCRSTITFFVLAGNYYSLKSLAGSPSIVAWTEWQ